jgi:hypothetical protein
MGSPVRITVLCGLINHTGGFLAACCRGLFQTRRAMASRWLWWFSATAKTVPFHSLTPQAGRPVCDFINMLMIWLYALLLFISQPEVNNL